MPGVEDWMSLSVRVRNSQLAVKSATSAGSDNSSKESTFGDGCSGVLTNKKDEYSVSMSTDKAWLFNFNPRNHIQYATYEDHFVDVWNVRTEQLHFRINL